MTKRTKISRINTTRTIPDNNMSTKSKKVSADTKTSAKKRKNSQKKKTFNTYIVKVLKQIHPDLSIGEKEGIPMINSMLEVLVKNIARAVSLLLRRTGKSTVTSREIMYAVRLVFPGELNKHAYSELAKAVTRYNATLASVRTPEKKQRVVAEEGKRSKASRAGLVFSVSRTSKIFYPYVQGLNIRKGAGAAVALAAVLQYICAEILELGGNAARDSKKKSIKPRHLALAILNDEELSLLFKRTVMQGGNIPNIHTALLPKHNINKNNKVIRE